MPCIRQNQNSGLYVPGRLQEAFKPQSLTQVLLNGVAKPSYAFVATNTTQGVSNNQNVPGAVYDTESGFVNSLDRELW